MAESVLAQCAARGLLDARPAGATIHLPLVGAPEGSGQALTAPPGLHLYGTDARLLQRLPGHGNQLAPGLTEAMVRFAVRYEYARTVEDVLARRARLLFLDAQLAASIAPRVADILVEELGNDFDAARSLRAFLGLASHYGELS
jgi:glycerol-3-phosphate dehydrogenase